MTMNFDPMMAQKVAQVANMLQRGKDVKSMISTFKQTGMSPQVVEQALFMAFPQLKTLKQQMDSMKQAGMSQDQIFAEFAKQANADPAQISNMYNDLMRIIN